MKTCKECGNVIYNNHCPICGKTYKAVRDLDYTDDSIVDTLLARCDEQLDVVKTANGLSFWSYILLFIGGLFIALSTVLLLILSINVALNADILLGILSIAGTILGALLEAAILMICYHSIRAKAINTVTSYSNAKINECQVRNHEE